MCKQNEGARLEPQKPNLQTLETIDASFPGQWLCAKETVSDSEPAHGNIHRTSSVIVATIAQSMLVGDLMMCLEAHEAHHVGTLIVALNSGTCMESVMHWLLVYW